MLQGYMHPHTYIHFTNVAVVALEGQCPVVVDVNVLINKERQHFHMLCFLGSWLISWFLLSSCWVSWCLT